MLEQGPRFSLRSFRHDELKDWYLGGITNDAVKNPQTFRSDAAKKAELQKFKPALWYGRGVGGASLHYTANYWRLHEIDFIERSVLGAIAGTGFADWPITYADLEPYYTKVEWEIGVSGLAGASPFDPPRTQAVSDAAAAGEVVRRAASNAARASSGLHPFPAPMAINSQPYRGRPACVHCGFCHGFACEVRRQGVDADDGHSGGGSDRPVRGAAGELRRSGSRPTTQGRATGVAYFDRDRREHFQTRARRWSCAPTAPRRRGCC